MTTPIMQSPLAIPDLVDWGVIPTMIEGESHTSGTVSYTHLTLPTILRV